MSTYVTCMKARRVSGAGPGISQTANPLGLMTEHGRQILPFVSLRHVFYFKRQAKREKDERDIEVFSVRCGPRCRGVTVIMAGMRA